VTDLCEFCSHERRQPETLVGRAATAACRFTSLDQEAAIRMLGDEVLPALRDLG